MLLSEEELDIMIAPCHNAEPFVVVIHIAVCVFNINNSSLFIETCFADKFSGELEMTFV